MSDVLLLRHPPVAKAWAGRCYGRSDMGWSRAGAAMASALVDRLGGQRFEAIVHSGALRTRRLAVVIATCSGAPLVEDPNWLERDFGSWEGRRWQAIWRETGNLMDGMMTDPTGFRPGGGETGEELSLRAQMAWRRLTGTGTGTVLVVAHGGPIAALRCWKAGAPLQKMIDFVPACGEIVGIAR